MMRPLSMLDSWIAFDLLTVDALAMIRSMFTAVVDSFPLRLWRTMRCNGAGLARFHEWIVKRPGPLIATVLPLN